MRLIDADKITTETFKAYVGENGGFISFGDAVDAIDAIPTAYDVDKVVEELDWAIYPYLLFDIDNCELTESLLKADMVESIVRRGGV